MGHLEHIDIKDVKTRADVNKLFTQECSQLGIEVACGSYIFGMIAIPYAFRNYHKRIPISIEYKLAISALSLIIGSYYAGVYAKNRCERNLKEKLKEDFSF